MLRTQHNIEQMVPLLYNISMVETQEEKWNRWLKTHMFDLNRVAKGRSLK